MSAEKTLFGYINENEPVYLYKISNKNGMYATLQTLGAGIQSLFVPDRWRSSRFSTPIPITAIRDSL